MRNSYTFLTVIVFCFLTQTLFAQTKTPIQPNFVSPFGQKQNSVKPQIIRPSGKVQQKQTPNNEYTIQKDAEYALIKFSEKSKVTTNNFFQEFSNTFGISDADKFVVYKTENDEIGFTHYRYKQTYKGINVTGGEYLLHEKNGKLISANGNFYPGLSLNTTPTISKEIAIQNAIKNIGAKKYQWENQEEENFLKKETNNPNASYYPTTELLIAPKNGIYKNEDFRLCYKVKINAAIPYEIYDVFVDAQTGEVINKVSEIAHADVPGNANTLYSGTKTITMDSYSGSYRLRETGRPIQTLNMLNGTNYSNAVDFTNSTTNWTAVPMLNSFTISAVAQSWWYTTFVDESPDIYIKIMDGSSTIVFETEYYNNTNPILTFNDLNISMVNPPYSVEIWDYEAVGGDDFGGSYAITTSAGTFSWSGGGNNGSYNVSTQNNVALDIHWGMEKTYDFFLNQLSRNSFDNAGSVIKNYVHYDQSLGNAFWNGTAMSYGDGDQTFSPLGALDVVGHEFSHAVIEYTANLEYQGESGALNESFADIFGTAIEFYGATSPNWTMGEACTIASPFFLRSMSNPNSGLYPQPDTYNATYWGDPSGTQDNGGVHINSGVQNYWYYLLSQGGSGTNDIGNAFSVPAIGINSATEIAYRNLRLYLTTNSDYMASYYGSLQAAEDLFGANSTQQNAVRAAWYAVGIGNNPNGQCSGTVEFTAPSGSFSDGSGTANYQDNLDCYWLIQPTGANTIALNFPTFDTEDGYDSVMVYDGTTTSDPLLMTLSGNALPTTINSTNGALLVRFMSDYVTNANGWSATYSSSGTAYCDGGSLLTSATGSFNDGSGANDYGNNQECYWLIAPPCASSVTLSFSQFNTEAGYDGILVYNGNNTNAPLLLSTSGTTIPSNVTASSGEMLVVFVSDYAVRKPGFTASYTSTGAPYCSGTTTLNTLDYGTIADGSGGNNYCNNMDCRWLIQPPQASTITFNFSTFDVEPNSTDGFIIYDAVEIYDGTNTSAPLLGRFYGNSLPPSVTSTGGSMYIRFFSDEAEFKQGWDGYYTSTQTGYCTGTTTLTTPSGTFTDGSNLNNYGNNADCKWLIQPTGATQITLNFNSFDTELNYDGIIVYDGNNTSANQLGTYSGTSIPPTITSTGGSMLVQFLSDDIERKQGWSATYNSLITETAVLSGSTTICSGTSTNLSVAVTGGVPPYTVTVTNGTNTYSSTGASPVSIPVSPSVTSTYTIVSVTGGGGAVTGNSGAATVTITPSSTNTTTASACNSYTWNGTNYTASGTYTGTTANCVTQSLNLTITPNSTNTTTASACNSYTWNGTAYNLSGVYTGAASNCGPQILNLTITPSSTNTTTATSCNSYTWNGTTYTSSGLYTGTTANCVTQALNLTITPNSTNTTTTTACGTYTWNGTTYTTSGTYTGTTANCGAQILNLTITPNSTNTTTASACNSYVWNGTTYTASGVYTGTTANCVTQSLNLTITPSSTNTTTATECDTYTWNGTTYTSSGVYTGTTTNCVTQALNLTITPNSTNTTTVAACGNYTWNGQTYSSSGVYTGTTANCVTQALNLTINTNTSSSISQTALDSYTWPVNNQTYTTTGAYTAVIPNAAGCDSTITLNLTISFSGINDLSATKLSIYPNPTNGDFTITGLELVGTVSSLTLSDMNGKVVKVLDTKATKFSMASIKPGVYFLNIISGNKQEVLKIVKE
jgi:Zn-dependent metalloprotease